MTERYITNLEDTARRVARDEDRKPRRPPTIEVETIEYERSHGKRPRGWGSWGFTFETVTYRDASEVWFAPVSTFGDAVKAAKAEAQRRGARMISAQP